MLDINFEGNPTLWDLINFSTKNNIDIYALLHTAIIKEALFTEEMELVSSFVESLRDKSKITKSQFKNRGRSSIQKATVKKSLELLLKTI